MFKRILALTALSCSMLMAEALPMVFIERFDNTSAKCHEGACIESGAGIEKGALAVEGRRQNYQIAYTKTFDAVPGEQYAFALQFKTSANFPNLNFITLVVFRDAKGKQCAESAYFRHPRSSSRFMHRTGVFTVPEKTATVSVALRLVNVPESEKLWVDNLRIGKVRKDGTVKVITLDSFDVSFDNWRLDSYLLFERMMFGPGGSIVNEWKQAKVGEAFFRCQGSEEKMQYSMMIENLNVVENSNYVFEGFYKAGKDFDFNGHGILIFFQKDKDGRALGQTRFHIRDTKGEWKPILHTFTTPPNCKFIDIGLNTRNMRPEEEVCLDHIRFRPGEKGVVLSSSIDSSERALTVTAVPLGVATGDIAEMSLVILNGQGAKAIERKTELGRQELFSLAEMPDGNYELECTVALKDGKTLSSKKPFSVCNNPYWLNEIGIQKPENAPPAPWKPLALSGNSVATWMGDLDFDGNLLLGTLPGVLSSPMRLTVNAGSVAGAGKAAWKVAPALCTAEKSVSGDGWKGTLNVAVDYTGFVRYKLELIANQELTLNEISAAFNLETLDFIHRSDDSWTDVGSVVLAGREAWSTRHFFNELMFGGMERGLAWYLPEMLPAKADFGAECVKVDVDAREVRVYLLCEPVALASGQKVSLEFAVAPYPFRPQADNWRRLRYRAGKDSNLDLLWQTSRHFKYFGTTAEAFKPKAIKELLDSRSKSGVKWLFYQFPFYIMDTIPECSFFEKEWRALPSRSYDFRGNGGGMAFKGDIRRRTWQDYYMLKFHEHLSKYDWDGVYYDCFGADLCTENGRLFHPEFEARLFQERLYITQRKLNPDSLTIVHLGADQAGTAAAFADVVLMGEQYRSNFSRHDYYMEFMSLDQFRFENAVKVGPDRMLLPQYRRADQTEGVRTTSHFMGIALLHNLMIYPNFILKELELKIRGRLYAFGLENAVFHPYWIDGGPIATDNSEVKLSSYKNGGGIFAVAFNPSSASQKFRVKGIPGGAFTVYDPVTDKETRLNADDALKLEPCMPLFITSGNN
ncbi:MAG: hypothetical protein IJS15_08085 [Victivallales bacterium]|nr:hypothetical protein [Victivallales bacterium]